ncbi:MAG: poly-gamma-glutamate biosynthesis protein PgsC [Myxococcales bacterium]|nr:poly-gamma-glutamate biosynthesis protein PgsC [Myxococcales bacterium]
MLALLPEAIGMGLAISLLFTEFFGLAAGGMVVPGYVALYLTDPASVAGTLIAGVLTFLAVHALKSVVILYGRRLTAVTIVMGYLVGMGLRAAAHGGVVGASELEFIGFIIPGLIAIWCNRQGVMETVTAILTVSAVTRLALVVALGEELLR